MTEQPRSDGRAAGRTAGQGAADGSPGLTHALRVSVIVAAFNRRDDLRRCLDSLVAIRYPDLEIIVVDDGSSDGTAEMVQADFPQVLLCQAQENMGLAKARNIGAVMSSGTYLWFLDSDAEVRDGDFTTRVVELMEAAPSLGAVGGEAVVDSAGALVGTKSLVAEVNGMVRGQFLLDQAAYGLIPAAIVAGCNFFVRRRILFELGGFDSEFAFPAFDDLDLSYRIKAAGYDLAVIGQVPVYHRFSTTSRLIDLRRSGRARLYFVVKNFPLWKLLILPLLDLFYLLDFRHLQGLVRRAKVAEDGRLGAVRLPSVDEGRRPGLAGYLRTFPVMVDKVGTVLGGYIFGLGAAARAFNRRGREPDHLAAVELGQVSVFRPKPASPENNGLPSK